MFKEIQLLENLTALMDNIVRAKPGGIKGDFIKSAYLTSTMGPSVSMNIASIVELRVE